MNVLLVRPDPGNDRFGLGPFFRVEPLGLGYVAAALRARGDRVRVVDARFERRVGAWTGRFRPDLIGISCMHAVEYDSVVSLARMLRRRLPGVPLVVGGHTAAAWPAPLQVPDVDALVLGDGEIVLPRLAAALAEGRPLGEVAGLLRPSAAGWTATPDAEESGDLDRVPLPARDLVDRHGGRYHCLLFRPVWLVETARGCPFRCTFCSVWSLHRRSFRERSVEAVADDFEAVGEHVFVVDDLFWHHPERSLELARTLARRGVRKRWMLVQTRTDLACRHPELLEAWRPLARDFDIFFGLEAPTDTGLEKVSKDATVRQTIEAADVARALRYGVTGNFVVDPDWDEREFEELWEFVRRHGFERAGYTILTPLPGTDLHRQHPTLRRDEPWFKYDMHHLLWEPRLGPVRFFELYAETWRRSILNLGGRKSWWDWVRQVRPTQVPYLTRVLLRTQRMMRLDAYLAEYGGVAAAGGAPAARKEVWQ